MPLHRCSLRLWHIIGFLGLALSAAAPARAALTLNVDPATKTLFFTGSDTGSPLNLDDQAFIGWMTTDYNTVQSSYAMGTSLFYTTVSLAEDTRALFISGSSGFSIAILYPKVTGTPTGVVTYTAVASQIYDYGSVLTPDQQAILEAASIRHDSLSPMTGQNFYPMNTVPEPGSLWLVLFAGLAALLWQRRRATS